MNVNNVQGRHTDVRRENRAPRGGEFNTNSGDIRSEVSRCVVANGPSASSNAPPNSVLQCRLFILIDRQNIQTNLVDV